MTGHDAVVIWNTQSHSVTICFSIIIIIYGALSRKSPEHLQRYKDTVISSHTHTHTNIHRRMRIHTPTHTHTQTHTPRCTLAHIQTPRHAHTQTPTHTHKTYIDAHAHTPRHPHTTNTCITGDGLVKQQIVTLHTANCDNIQSTHSLDHYTSLSLSVSLYSLFTLQTVTAFSQQSHYISLSLCVSLFTLHTLQTVTTFGQHTVSQHQSVTFCFSVHTIRTANSDNIPSTNSLTTPICHLHLH